MAMPGRTLTALLAASLACAAPGGARAHCDGLDGPVVAAARAALEEGDPAPVLAWVRPEAEPEVRAAFAKTLAVRAAGGAARDLADTWFFETVVRVHRVGEGAPYTGLEPAGRDLGPAIPAADRALESGKGEPLVRLLTGEVERGVRAHFEAARARRRHDPKDVAAGREYVERYVRFVHYVERLHEAATREAHGHFAEGVPAHGE